MRSLRCYSTIAPSTIYALSTKPGKSAIAVVRISGPSSLPILQHLGRRSVAATPRKAQLMKLRDPADSKQILDHALTLFFQGPRSYTGEDLVELHLHGGNAVVKAVLRAIRSLHSVTAPVKYAEPGEFTFRAFRNGQLDLTQVEGIRDIIDAETEYQRKAASVSAGGEFKVLYDSWRQRIIANIALCAVLIDFVDDNFDIQAESQAVLPTVTADIKALLSEVEQHLDALKSSELILSGINLNFMGPPNAGKSSLLNTLLNREAAIVSEVAGTTRDVVEAAMDIKGHKVVFGDTAGIRNLSKSSPLNADIIEAEGIRRSKTRIRMGDVVLVILPVGEFQVVEEIKAELNNLRTHPTSKNQRILVAINKIDLISETHAMDLKLAYSEVLEVPLSDVVAISCHSGRNISELLSKIGEICSQLSNTVDPSSHPIAASERVRGLIENELVLGLKAFLDTVEHADIVAGMSELQYAADGIGKITGQGVSVDEVLDVVFGDFCIGK